MGVRSEIELEALSEIGCERCEGSLEGFVLATCCIDVDDLGASICEDPS